MAGNAYQCLKSFVHFRNWKGRVTYKSNLATYYRLAEVKLT